MNEQELVAGLRFCVFQEICDGCPRRWKNDFLEE